jgi:O-antigen ligase/Tfp pilus assembly protein PilF
MEAPTSRPRLNLGGLLLWTALILLVFYLVFLGGGFAGIHSDVLRLASLTLIIPVFAAWAVAMIRNPAWRPSSRLMPAFLVCLAVFAVATALSRQPRLGLDYLAYSVLLTGLYLFLVRLLADPWYRPRILGLVTLLAVLIGVWYVQACVAKWIEWWGLVGRITAPPLRPEFESLTFGNPSGVLTMSVLLTIPAVAWIGVGTRRRAMASASLVVLSLVASLLSGSRAGWFALAVGLGLSSLAWLAVAQNRATVARLVRSRAALWVLGLGVVAVVVAGAVAAPGILFRSGSGGEALRGSYWDAALRMFGESPISGTGPGTWVAQRILYTPEGSTDYYIPHAHNIFVQAIAEFGLLGVVAGVVVAITLGRLIIPALREPDGRRRAMAWAAVLSIAYFAAHQLLDFYANVPPALFAFALPIAWLDATATPRAAVSAVAGRPERRWQLTMGAGTALVLAAILTLWWSEQSATRENSAVLDLNDGNAEAALPSARRAAGDDPGFAPYHFTHGLAAARTGHPEEAADAFRRVAEMDGLPESWLGLADAQVALGDAAGARDSLTRALRLGVQQPGVALAAADLHLKLGDVEQARALIGTVIAAVPSLAGDAQLAAHLAPALDAKAIVDEVIARSGPDAAVELAVLGNRLDEARALADHLEPERKEMFVEIIEAWTGDPAALRQFLARAPERPFDIELLTWSSRLSDHLGHPDAATRYRKWANIDNGLAGIPGLTVHVTVGPQGSSRNGGITSSFYGHYTYRRPTPWDQLPIDVLRLTYDEAASGG